MTAPRAKFLLAAAASTLPFAAPVSAQVADGVVINIMRECAKIDDPTARLACYDNNIRQAGAAPRASAPGQVQIPQGSGAAVAANSERGFGYEDVRTPERFQTPPGEAQQINPRVSTIRPREPGVYLLTMEDDTQWLFAEGVSSSYRLPRTGSTIEIERGALGSYLMRFEGQVAVPVRRVR
jgi:hypothetical protein